MNNTPTPTERVRETFANLCIVLIEDETLFERIIAELDQSPAQALGVCFNLCQFLVLKSLYPEELIEPSLTIDVVWHEFMLHTEAYMKFCTQNFGSYIHHRPTAEGHSFERTLELLRATFELDLSTASI
jgi:hypothetical protein